MKVHPIIFQPEMVRALIRTVEKKPGAKTQTRRLRWGPLKAKATLPADEIVKFTQGGVHLPTPLARVKVGDVLYVRENFALRGTLAVVKPSEAVNMARALPGMEDSVVYFADADGYDEATQNWLPSIHLPRFFSRLTLAVTEVRFERLQNISERDAVAEGLINKADASFPIWTAGEGFGEHFEFPVGAYQELWERINGKESWAENPEVVALTFTVHKQNVDEFLRERANAAA